MRKFGISLIACGLAAIPFAAFSQPSSTSSPDEYVCALTGECGQDEAAPAEADSSGARLEATRGFTLARPDAAPQRTTRAPVRRRQAARPVFRPRVATRQQGRVNLRLAFAPEPFRGKADAPERQKKRREQREDDRVGEHVETAAVADGG